MPIPVAKISSKLREIKVTWHNNFDDATGHVHIDLEPLDLSTTKVSQLKEIVNDRLGLPIHNQIIIINDHSTTSDDDFLLMYEGFGKRKTREKRSAVNDGFASANDIMNEDENKPLEVFVINKEEENYEKKNAFHLNKKQVFS